MGARGLAAGRGRSIGAGSGAVFAAAALAGPQHGKQAAVDYIQSIRERYPDGGIELEVIDMLAGEERVVLLVRERFHGDGPPVEIRRANVYRVKAGKVVEVSIFEADQYVVDELLH